MYAALLVAPDGDYVVTYESNTKDEVIDKLVNRGSNWYFYPFEFIIRYPFNPNGYIVDHPYGILGWPNKRIKIKNVLNAFERAIEFMEKQKFKLNNINDYIAFIANFLK
jgi:hypothetical protein